MRESISFAALGRRLERLEGETICVALAYVRGGGAPVIAGARGTAHLVDEAEQAAMLANFGGYELPPDTIEPGERAYLLEVDGFSLAISSQEFRGARDVEGCLSFQAGPMLVMITIGRG